MGRCADTRKGSRMISELVGHLLLALSVCLQVAFLPNVHRKARLLHSRAFV